MQIVTCFFLVSPPVYMYIYNMFVYIICLIKKLVKSGVVQGIENVDDM